MDESLYLEGNPPVYIIEQPQWVHPVRLTRLTVRGILVSMVVWHSFADTENSRHY